MSRIFIEPAFSDLYNKYPLGLIDIGASGGFAPNWKPASKYLKVVGFEPDEREFQNLQHKNDGQVTYLNTALYSGAQEVEFFMNRKQQTSSVFKPNRSFLDQFPDKERYDVMDVARMRTDSLDNQLEKNNISQVDFIKVDTDGSELFVLQGASRTLDRHIFGVESEIEYAPMHLGQPQFHDVDKFMHAKGFALFDLKNYYWKRARGKDLGKARGQIIFGDALYLKTIPSTIDLLSSLSDAAQKQAKLLKIIGICALYGYYDYGYELYEQVKVVFDKSRQAAIEEWFRKSRGWYARIPVFPGRHKLSRLFYNLSELIKPTHQGWAAIERELGNR